jgi:hypothetical protein
MSANFPSHPSSLHRQSDAYDNAMKLLNEALATQRQLETENASLQKANAQAQKNVEEMSVYLKTQDTSTSSSSRNETCC